MYKPISRIVYGFHGCDQSVKDEILHNGGSLKMSVNPYDWLGTGIYFWENDPQRALEFAIDASKRPKQSKGHIEIPTVIGAVIDLAHCCDLTKRENIELLRIANEAYLLSVGGENNAAKNKGNTSDMIGRYRDCAVINMLHQMMETSSNYQPYDSVRSVFFEGKPIYPTSFFFEHSHVQLCIRNPNCIKAIFDPREPDNDFILP